MAEAKKNKKCTRSGHYGSLESTTIMHAHIFKQHWRGSNVRKLGQMIFSRCTPKIKKYLIIQCRNMGRSHPLLI